MPTQPELGKPGQIRMMQRHLEHGILGQLIKPRPFAGGIDDQRQNVESTTFAAPAEPMDRGSEICVLAVSSPRAVRSSITRDRKSTRLNSSHLGISYAVFCLKKKKKKA